MRGEPIEEGAAVEALAALGHPTRIEAVRQLVGAGDAGLAAGAIARVLDVRENALSPHLARLVQAGLATRRREGRAVRYEADVAGLSGLLDFLLKDCCGGRPELCAPVPSERKEKIA